MTKTSLRCYAPWAWRKNEADLNRRGREGWKLEKAGFLRYTFAQDRETAWACAVDYCPRELWPGEWQRRQEAAAAAGWELVSHTKSGWAYFRRPADQGSDYPRAYSPEQERQLGQMGAMFWIWIVLLAVGVAGAAVAVIRQKAMVIPAVIFLAIALVLYFRMQALEKSLKPQDAPQWKPDEPANGGAHSDAPDEAKGSGGAEPGGNGQDASSGDRAEP